MSQKSELIKLYDTVFTVPGMSEPVKVDLKMSRKNILILSKIIERGIRVKGNEEKGDSIMDVVQPETVDELQLIAEELLQKAQLSDVNEKLKSFSQ
jgi:hypothetical protein